MKYFTYYNDYNRYSFYNTKDTNGVEHFYLNYGNKHIEVSHEVYNVCRASYAKMKYDHERNTIQKVKSYGDIDIVSPSVSNKDKDIDYQLFLDELTRNIKHDIQILDTLEEFDKKDQMIAEMYFLNNYKKKEIAEKVGFTNIKSVNNRLKRIKGFFINKYENPFF